MLTKHRARALSVVCFGLLVAASGCATVDPYQHLRDTRVGREQRVLTGTPRLDEYFGAVWEIQRVLASADLRRADAMARIATTLQLNHDAPPDRIGTAVRRLMADNGITSVDVSIEPSHETFDVLNDWVASVARTPDRRADAHFVRLEASLTVVVQFHGTQPGTLTAVGAAMTTLLRRCNALQAAMETLGPSGEELATRGEALALEFPRWRLELDAAVRFAQSVTPRVTAHAQESQRLIQWVRAALTPDH